MILGAWDPDGVAEWRDRLRRAAPGADVRDGATIVAAGVGATATVDGERWILLSGEALGPGRVAALGAPEADGAYAALAWEGERGALSCDPLGMSSLFLASRGSALLFASELTGLLALLERTPEPDPDAVRGWLAGGTLPPDGTLLAGVRRLRPGCRLLLTGRAPREEGHARPASGAARADSAEAAAALVRTAVTRAVALRCPVDERVGVLLSGGLDSTVVAGAGARALPAERRPFAHYSVLFPGLHGQDESAWIEMVSAELGTRSVRMSVRGGSVVDGMLDWTAAHSAPLPAASWFYQRPLLARIAGDGCAAVLDGEGGDELFAAPRQLLADHVRRGRLVEAWRDLHALPNARRSPLRVRVRAFGQYAVRASLPYEANRRLQRPGADVAAFDARWGWQRRSGPRWSARLTDVITDGIARVGAHEHFRLRSASAGLRVRHPLFDLELAELVLALPPRLAFDSVYSRVLLRRSMEGLVPQAILRRTDKARFESLIVRVLSGPDLQALRALLGPDRAVRELAPPGWPHDLATPPGNGRGLGGWADRAFRAAATECWLRTLADPGFPDRFREEHALAPTDVSFDG